MMKSKWDIGDEVTFRLDDAQSDSVGTIIEVKIYPDETVAYQARDHKRGWIHLLFDSRIKSGVKKI